MLVTAAAGRPDPNGDPDFIADVDAAVDAAIGGAFRHHISAVFSDGNSGENLFANFGATQDTSYEIGSITKTFTGHLVADAIERAEITADTKIGDVLPALTGGLVNRTFAQLATHSAGLPQYPSSPNSDDTTIAELYASVSTDYNAANVGSYTYSNPGGALTGQGVAAAAGYPGDYKNLIADRIFGPVGMKRAYMPVVASGLLPGAPLGYTTGGSPAPSMCGGPAYCPAGGIRACTSDIARMLQGIMAGAAPGMDATNQHISGSVTWLGWFWGWVHKGDGSNRVEHNGGTSGFGSYWGIDLTHKKALFIVADTALAGEMTTAGQSLLVTYGGTA